MSGAWWETPKGLCDDSSIDDVIKNVENEIKILDEKILYHQKKESELSKRIHEVSNENVVCTPNRFKHCFNSEQIVTQLLKDASPFTDSKESMCEEYLLWDNTFADEYLCSAPPNTPNSPEYGLTSIGLKRSVAMTNLLKVMEVRQNNCAGSTKMFQKNCYEKINTDDGEKCESNSEHDFSSHTIHCESNSASTFLKDANSRTIPQQLCCQNANEHYELHSPLLPSRGNVKFASVVKNISFSRKKLKRYVNFNH